MFLFALTGFWRIEGLRFLCFLLFLKSLVLIQSRFYIFNYFLRNFIIDKINSLLVILLVFIMVMRFLASRLIVKNNSYYWNKVALIMILCLILLFLTPSITFFYVYFEFSILPIFVIIIGWGYQTERVRAGLALIFYTISASIPFLLFVLYSIVNQKVFFFSQYFIKINFHEVHWVMGLRSIIAFLVKLPVFMGHLWLPKAHVEAPVVGSIILASILLKLGGYGLIRLSNIIIFNSVVSYILSVALTGSALIGLICLTQMDMKVIIAYSSVAHMGITIGGVIYLTQIGVAGALILMIAHGLRSSIIFFGGNALYLRRFSRSIVLRKGFLSSMPLISFFWLFTIIRSIATPPIINLMAEVMCISSILRFSYHNLLWMILSIFLAGGYSILLYSRTQQSRFFNFNSFITISSGLERVIFLNHLVWVLFLALRLNLFII